MSEQRARPLTRRELTALAVSGSAGLVIAACGGDGGSDGGGASSEATVAESGNLEPTPSCEDGEPTAEQTEGPFFSTGSPQRTSVREAGTAGTALLLSGRVLDTDCRPIAGAKLDFWQADGEGAYDNEGFRLRGHQFADSEGRYRLETVIPGNYPGRTRHIHVKAQPRGAALLTTQLYFPGESGNDGDPLFDPALLVELLSKGGNRSASFDFVLET